jgi:hypothetical protein
MKKVRHLVLAAATMLVVSCGVVGTTGGNQSQTGSILGAVLTDVLQGGTISNVITSVIGAQPVTRSNLIGSCKYVSPGCAFTSENLLAKAGGEVAAAQIEEKVTPYYQQVGISASNTQITFNQDGTFSSRIAGTNFSGTYTFNEASQQIKLKGMLLSITCYTKREIKGISILFEAKKLLTVLQTMSALSGNANLQTIGDLSKQYDGVRVGFDMKR